MIGKGGDSGFPGLDQLGATAKGVPIHSDDVGPDGQIGFAVPVVFGLALQVLEAPIHDLEDIAGLGAECGGAQVSRDAMGELL